MIAMNDLATPYTATRSRRSDPGTSHDAAKHAASNKAGVERKAIRQSLEKNFPYGMTAREIAAATGIDYIECQRRISEVAGIARSGERRDGMMIWRAV